MTVVSDMTTEQRSTQTYRVTLAGLIVNVLLSGIKFLVGHLGNSQAVVADAVHSLSDLTTDIAVLFGVRFWSAPADADHPYGHERIETIVTVAIGIVLAVAALGIGYGTLSTIHDAHVSPPSLIAIVGSALSIVFKELLYRWTIATGRRIQSSAVMANAAHHRSDAFSSVPVLVAVVVAAIKPGWAFVDHLGALIVCAFILRMAWHILTPALAELADRGASEKHRERIGAIAAGIEGVRSVHKIRTRHIGPSLLVDLHVLVDGSMSVRRGHQISEDVKKALLLGGPDVSDVVVHLEPAP